MIFFGETEERIMERIDSSSRSGLFPVVNRGMWHSGIHVFYPEKDTVIKNPVSGKFVAGNFDDSKFWRYMVIKNEIELPDKEEKAIECYNLYSHLGASEELNDFMKEIGSESEIELTAENLEKIKKMPFYIKAYINLPVNTCTDEKNYKIITVDGKEESGYGIFNRKLKKCDIDVFANGERIGKVREDNVKKMKYENYENGKYLFSTKGGNIQLESVEGYLKVEDWMSVSDNLEINLPDGTNADRKDSPGEFVLWQKVGKVYFRIPESNLLVISYTDLDRFVSDYNGKFKDEYDEIKKIFGEINRKGIDKMVCVPEDTQKLYFSDFTEARSMRFKKMIRITDKDGQDVNVYKVSEKIMMFLKIVYGNKKNENGELEFPNYSTLNEELWKRAQYKCIKYTPLNFSEKYGNFFNAVRLLDGQGKAIGEGQDIAGKNFVYVKLHCFKDSVYTISVNEENLTKEMLNISDKNPLNYYYFNSTQVFQKDDAMACGVYGLPKTETDGKAEGEVEITDIDFLSRQFTEEGKKDKSYFWILTKSGYVYALKKNIKKIIIRKKIPVEGEEIKIGANLGWAQSKDKVSRNETPGGTYPYYLDYGLFFTEDIRKKKVYLKKVKITGKKEYKKQKLEIEENGINVFFIPPGATVDWEKIEGNEQYVKITGMTFRVNVYPPPFCETEEVTYKLKDSAGNIFLCDMEKLTDNNKDCSEGISVRIATEKAGQDENYMKRVEKLAALYLKKYSTCEIREKAQDGDTTEYCSVDITKKCDSVVELETIGGKMNGAERNIKEYTEKLSYESFSVPVDMEYSEFRDFHLQEEDIDGETYVRFPKPYDGGYLYVPKDSVEIEIKETLQDILGMTDFNCGKNALFSSFSPVDRLYFKDGELENCKSVLREQLKDTGMERFLSEEQGILFNFNAGGGDEKNRVYGSIYNRYLRRIICKHPVEWDNSENQLTNKAAKEKFERGFEDSKDCDIYSELKETQSIGNRENLFYFMNPFYFYNKMEGLGLMEYNPYEGKTYRQVYVEKDEKKFPRIRGNNFSETIDFVIADNPGFAPVYDKKHPNKGPNIRGYAPVTGFFNEDYLDVRTGNGLTYRENRYTVFNHEGVDFRGGAGTEIKSLIYGTVLAYGRDPIYGWTVFVCNRKRTGVYLLGHLSDFNEELLEKGEIMPGDIVGRIGGSGPVDSSGNIDGRFATHLHLSYFKIIKEIPENDIKSKIVEKTGDVIKRREYYNKNMSQRNPFHHESKRKTSEGGKK